MLSLYLLTIAFVSVSQGAPNSLPQVTQHDTSVPVSTSASDNFFLGHPPSNTVFPSLSHSTVLQHTYDSVLHVAEQRNKVLKAIKNIEDRITQVEERRKRLLNGQLRDIKEGLEKRRGTLRQIETTTEEKLDHMKKTAEKRFHSAEMERDKVVSRMKRLNLEVTRDHQVQQDEIGQQQDIMQGDMESIMGPLRPFLTVVNELKPKKTSLTSLAVGGLNRT